MGRDDAESASPTADRDVREHVLVAVLWAQPESRDCDTDNDAAGICKKRRSYDEALHLLNIGYSRFGRGVKDNDNGSKDTQEARNLADETEPFLEENGRENRGDDDRQSAKGSDQNGIGKDHGAKVANLAKNHESHASPPVEVFQVAVTLSSDFVVLLVGFEQADLLHNERNTNETSGSNGQAYTNDLEVSRSAFCCWVCGGLIRPRIQHVGCIKGDSYCAWIHVESR